MIWGKTYEEKMSGKNLWFAWYPVSLIDGRRAWLEVVIKDQYRSWGGNFCQYRELVKPKEEELK